MRFFAKRLMRLKVSRQETPASSRIVVRRTGHNGAVSPAAAGPAMETVTHMSQAYASALWIEVTSSWRDLRQLPSRAIGAESQPAHAP